MKLARSSVGPLTLMTTGLSRGESMPRPGTSPVSCSMTWYWTPALVDRSVIWCGRPAGETVATTVGAGGSGRRAGDGELR